MALAVVGLPLVPPPSPAHADELSDALAEQRALDRRIAQQRAQVARLNALQASLQKEIAGTHRALSAVNVDLAAVRAQIAKTQARLDSVAAAYRDLVHEYDAQTLLLGQLGLEAWRQETLLAERRQLLASRIRAAYQAGRVPLLETILSSASFTDALLNVSYYLDVGHQDQALAQEIAQRESQLQAFRQVVDSAREQTAQLRDETAAQKAALDAALADQQRAQAQLKALEARTAALLAQQRSAYQRLARNKQALQAAIAADEAAQQRLQARIDELLRRQYALGHIPSEYNGSLEWPLIGVVTQEFGCTGVIWEPPVGSCPHFHQGIDIAVDMYTPVRAAGSGIVLFAGPNPYDPPPKAWIVVIAHSQRLVTWYAHLDNAVHPPTVRAGDVVAAGQIIGYVGMTGRTTGPHLHWAVEFDGAFVNPRLFV